MNPRLSLRIYLSGITLFLASLFLPAYSPLGAVDYTGWNALAALLSPRLYGLLDAGRLRAVLVALVLVAAGLNNLLAFLSPLLFPLRRRFQRRRWFRISVALLLVCAVLAVLIILLTGFIRLRYGGCVWLLAIVLIDLSLLMTPPCPGFICKRNQC